TPPSSPPIARDPSELMRRNALCGCFHSRPISRESTSCLLASAARHRASHDPQRTRLQTRVELIVLSPAHEPAPAQGFSELAGPVFPATVQCDRRCSLG